MTVGLADHKHLNEYPHEIPPGCVTGADQFFVGQPLLAVLRILKGATGTAKSGCPTVLCVNPFRLSRPQTENFH